MRVKSVGMALRIYAATIEEAAMDFPHAPGLSRLATVPCALMSTSAGFSAALASQGPGASYGTASPSSQLIMAIIVYGSLAAILVAGLVGSLRRRL
jgi:hypothetical protein